MEGAAADAAFYYVTGSHAAKRASCDSNPYSRMVFRFAIDPATGRARNSPSGQIDMLSSDALWRVMATLPSLKAYVGDRKCLGADPPLGKRGVNIEGLASDGEHLFFGFRGPAQNGIAKILVVNVKALFEGGETQPRVEEVPVGAHRGIRDLQVVAGGLLVLAGPDDDKGSRDAGWTISFLSARQNAVTVELARLDLSHISPHTCPGAKPQDSGDAVKPEGIAVIGETPYDYEILILSDGMCDGGPMKVTVVKQ